MPIDVRRRALTLLEEALGLPAAERPVFLTRACQRNAALRREVDALLAADADAGSFGGAPKPLSGGDNPGAVAVKTGTRLGPYIVERRLGSGGMGEVFLGRDTRLDRLVAIKILVGRFSSRTADEARAVAALNHPHICTLYDVGDDYLVMEFLDGETLASLLSRGPLPIDRVLQYGAETAGALATAHAAGIVHRDLKPANIMITTAGVKVLDFGLAKRVTPASPDAPTGTAHLDSQTAGSIVGTTPYMSPEQTEGRTLDCRSDIWALGVLLYEMVSGKRPFRGDSPYDTVAAILQASPVRPGSHRPGVPEALERIIAHCLRKDPAERFESARAVELALLALARPRSGRRPLAIAVAILVLGSISGIVGLTAYRTSRLARWAESEAPTVIERLIAEERRMAAYGVYREALRYAPDSPALAAIGLKSTPVRVTTSPEGGEVSVADYVDGEPGSPSLIKLGPAPVTTDVLPRGGYYRLRVEKAGFDTVEQTIHGSDASVDVLLHERGQVPQGMVWVPGAPAGTPVLGTRLPLPSDLGEYWIDRFEVTNREFKIFVDAGGYGSSRYWTEPFLRDGQTVDWTSAMTRLVDATGRPGPAAWRFGNYAEDASDLPVTGVSWYEAAAYAAFAGKRLPSVYHWYRATGVGFYSNIITLSNYSGVGPAPVGRHRGLSQFGPYDQAGNVKEWAANPVRDEGPLRRFVLGGAWNENPYTLTFLDASDPWTRSASVGFRCARLVSTPAAELEAPLSDRSGRPRTDPPVSDEVYAVFARLHEYDHADLAPIIDKVDESTAAIRRETVSYTAAYGGGRTLAHLFLPRGANPPYQVVIVVPSGNIIRTRSIDALYDRFDFLALSGRAVIVPVLEQTLERGTGEPLPAGRHAERDRLLHWSKDVRRAIDYAERRHDLDVTRLAYFGISLGAVLAPTFIAAEPRFDTAVLLSGGTRGPIAPEVDPWNYAPRVTIPLLMLNGRDDFIYPAETRQLPLFNAFATPAGDKRRTVHDGGHVNLMIRLDVIREILGWLDSRLGPPR